MFVKFWSEFCTRCCGVFRPIGGFFINLCETCITIIVWLPSVVLLFRAVCVFPYHQLDFANFASQPIIMEICKELRAEWESVVFFGINENVGEERGEKEERAVGWWWCRRCVDERCLTVTHHEHASNSGGRSPGSQTPGDPATPFLP